MDTLLAGGDSEFDGHDVHVLISMAAVNIEYSPALQLVHTDDPGVSLYVPGLHSEQKSPLGPVCPALQMHAVCILLPDGECESAGQLAHATIEEAPFVVEYVPVEQFTHEISCIAPIVSEYFPVPHSMHVV